MLLCGWQKRKKKQPTSPDRYDKCVPPVEDQKQVTVTETSIPENIAVKSEEDFEHFENVEDPQISNQSTHSYFWV